jgi:hypothetical protein
VVGRGDEERRPLGARSSPGLLRWTAHGRAAARDLTGNVTRPGA